MPITAQKMPFFSEDKLIKKGWFNVYALRKGEYARGRCCKSRKEADMRLDVTRGKIDVGAYRIRVKLKDTPWVD